jgi:16S rRNA (cytidine1402-2'-O)-methyltransferase
MAKTLYIVATPIGNLLDITLRAIEVLQTVNLILAEDTRHSKKLLEHHNINTKLMLLHEHNEIQVLDNILDLLQDRDLALISDAGTPLISDPGYKLVNFVKNNGVKVVPIPGANSVITALCSSGLPTNNFCFLGFIPTKQNDKLKFIAQLNLSNTTCICFESPKRILATVQMLADICDENRIVCLAKELTKNFETIITDKIAHIINYLEEDDKHQNGEFVLIISPNNNENKNQKLAEVLPALKDLPKSQAAKIAAKLTGLSKNICYEQLLKLNESPIKSV